MKPGFVSYIRTLLTIIFLSWGVIPEVFAGCNISGNGGNPATVQFGNDSNLLIVFYVQIMPDDLVMQLHR
ncbi:hypothetical protein QU836_24265, partial [Escherichia coli]|nr:hypothetical protein [Escherichia coli]